MILDDDLHHADGTHRTTPRTGAAADLERHEAALCGHLADGHDHEPKGLTWWGSECTDCGNATHGSMRCDSCGTAHHTVRMFVEDDGSLAGGGR